MKPFLTVFIPAYNEEHSLAHCVEVVQAKLKELEVTCEVLIVDDASHDGTGRLADELASRLTGVRAVHHPRNLGIGGAFVTALNQAQGEWLILIPADLALEPSELQRYIEAAPVADIVVGLRSDRSDYTLLRRMVSWTNIHLIQLLFGMKLRQFQYISMYRMEVLGGMQVEYWRSAFFLAEVLIKARDLRYRLVEVEIRYAPRLQGKPTGAKLKLVIFTLIDIFRFWLRWLPARAHLPNEHRIT
jgi:glycosyltransferase involved in cell wall biosynthesis